jgi:hypothetical protein
MKLPTALSRAGEFIGVSGSDVAAWFNASVSFGVMVDLRDEALIQHHRSQELKLLRCGL